jgi:hypothetical protein
VGTTGAEGSTGRGDSAGRFNGRFGGLLDAPEPAGAFDFIRPRAFAKAEGIGGAGTGFDKAISSSPGVGIFSGFNIGGGGSLLDDKASSRSGGNVPPIALVEFNIKLRGFGATSFGGVRTRSLLNDGSDATDTASSFSTDDPVSEANGAGPFLEDEEVLFCFC